MRVSFVLVASLLSLTSGRLIGDRDLVVCVSCTADDVCDDGDPCTADYCDTVTGCCSARPIPDCTTCAAAEDCTDHENNPCIDNPTCDGAPNGVCRYESTCPVPQCGFSTCAVDGSNNANCSVTPECFNDSDCDKDRDEATEDYCDTVSGCCQVRNCDDNIACTIDTGLPPTCLNEKRICDDNADNPCILDECREANGQCITHTVPDGHTCDTATGYVCSSGNCVECASAIDCDDGNPCTTDSCDVNNQCVNVNDDTATCNVDWICNAGNCVECTTDSHCDDGNQCTDDSCDTNTNQCDHVNNAATCNVDWICNAGACVECAANIHCDDGNQCTDDSCNTNTNQCDHVNNTATCNVDWICNAGTCVECMNPSDCDDGDACTIDTCVSNACQSSGGCQAPSICGSAGECCKPKGVGCNENGDCCNNKCKGQNGSKVCK